MPHNGSNKAAEQQRSKIEAQSCERSRAWAVSIDDVKFLMEAGPGWQQLRKGGSSVAHARSLWQHHQQWAEP